MWRVMWQICLRPVLLLYWGDPEEAKTELLLYLVSLKMFQLPEQQYKQQTGVIPVYEMLFFCGFLHHMKCMKQSLFLESLAICMYKMLRPSSEETGEPCLFFLACLLPLRIKAERWMLRCVCVCVRAYSSWRCTVVTVYCRQWGS